MNTSCFCCHAEGTHAQGVVQAAGENKTMVLCSECLKPLHVLTDVERPGTDKKAVVASCDTNQNTGTYN